MQQQPARPPHHVPNDDDRQIERDHDRRSQQQHPDDDRLTEADLDRHQRERRIGLHRDRPAADAARLDRPTGTSLTGDYR
jgi:hypothetical protein